MKKLKVFISSVQNEFTEERKALYAHFCTGALKTDHASYPTNLLLAESLYQAGYIERYGTGTGEIFNLTIEAGLKEPVIMLDEGFKVIIWRPVTSTDHVTGQVTGQATGEVVEVIRRVLLVLNDEMKSSEIQTALQLKHREYFRDNYLNPSLDQGFVEMILQEKPNSPNQKYRLTPKGMALKDRLLIHQSAQKTVSEEITTSVTGEATGEATGEVTGEPTGEVTEYVTEEVKRVIIALHGEMKRSEIQQRLELKHDDFFRKQYIIPALSLGYIDMTYPDRPNHPNQKYRLTSKGSALKQQLENEQ